MDDASIPIESIDVSDQDRFQANTHFPYFRRLREDDPVHFFDSERFGPFWSVTRYADILAVEKNHKVFSSELNRGGVTIKDDDFSDVLEIGSSFITMDPPQHTVRRGMVSSAFSKENLSRLEIEIQQHVSEILQLIPLAVNFDWVEYVANELPIRVLSTLFGVPQQDAHCLLRWSNLFVGADDPDVVASREAASEELQGFVEYFTELWSERARQPPVPDLVSMLVHGERDGSMTQADYIGTIVLLLIGGNDTTRNTISGGLWGLMQHPVQYQLLRDNPALIGPAVSEMIRWTTPIAHMRRTATCDYELGGKRIKCGEKVVLWYASGNRDETVFEQADQFLVNRQGPRHLSFGAGVHHCVGSRLAELQLSTLWKALLIQYPVIEPVSQPSRLWTNFIHGIKQMIVRIPQKQRIKS